MKSNLSMRIIDVCPQICSHFWKYAAVCPVSRSPRPLAGPLVPLLPVVYSGQKIGKTSSQTFGT